MFQTNFVENIKTYILGSVTFFFSLENCGVYEKMWKKKIVEPDRPQTAIQHCACTLLLNT